MATFKAQIEGLTGLTIGTSPTTAEVTQFLHDGVLEVTNRSVTLSPEESWLFQTVSSEQTSNNTFSNKGRVLQVLRETGVADEWVACSRISPDLQSRVTDVNSVYYASKFHPVYTIDDNGKMSVYPVPGSSNNGFKVYYISNDPKRDSDAATLAYDSEDIRHFPKDRVYLVVLYASIRSLGNALSAMNLPADVVFPAIPTAEALDSVTSSIAPEFSTSAVFVLPAGLRHLDIDFSSLPAFPSYTKPVFSPPSLPSMDAMNLPPVPVPDEQLIRTCGTAISNPPYYVAPVIGLASKPSFDDFTISSISPIPPQLETTDVDFATLVRSKEPSYESPSVPIIDDYGTLSGLTFSIPGLPTLPSPPVLSNHDAVTAGITNPNFTVPSFNLPNWSDEDMWINTEEDAELANVRTQSNLAKLQEYQSNIAVETAKWQKEQAVMEKDLNIALQNAQMSSQEDVNSIELFKQEIANYTSKVEKEITEFTSENQFKIQDYQVRSTTAISKYQSDVAKYAESIKDNLNAFQKETLIYQAEIQKATTDSQMLTAKDQNAISKYQQEVATYAQNITKEVQEFQGQFNKELQVWTQQNQRDLQKYQLDLQNSLNEFNVQNTEYQVRLQLRLQDSNLQESFESRKIQKYQSDISIYQSEVQKELQRWSAEVFGVTFNKWQQDFRGALEEYANNIQNESSATAVKTQEYTTKMTKLLQTYQAETGYDIGKYSAELQGKAQEFTTQLTKDSTVFTNTMQRYIGEFQGIASINQNKINDFASKVQLYGSELGALLQDYGAKIQKAGLDYGWMQSRQQELSAQYNQAFGLMAPQERRQQ